MGGAPARLLTYHVEDEWGPFLFMDAAVVHEDRGYDILWFSPRGREREDRERFEAILATFTFR